MANLTQIGNGGSITMTNKGVTLLLGFPGVEARPTSAWVISHGFTPRHCARQPNSAVRVPQFSASSWHNVSSRVCARTRGHLLGFQPEKAVALSVDTAREEGAG